MVKAYQNYFKHLGNFSGTASRREFWWPWLLNVIVGYVIMTILFNIFGMNVTRVLNFQPGKETFLASLINFIIFIANCMTRIAVVGGFCFGMCQSSVKSGY